MMNALKWFGTPRAGLFVAMAAIGLVLGTLAGTHFQNQTPAAAAGALAGKPCPTARDISSHAVVVVSEKGSRVDINSTLEVRLRNVDPPDPDSAHPAGLVSTCLLPRAQASLQFLDWSKGSLTARLGLSPVAVVGARRPDDFWSPVIAETGSLHSTLKVALCDQPGPNEFDLTGVYGEPLVCNRHSQTIIEVRVPTTPQTPNSLNPPSFEPAPQPFPQHLERKDNNISYIWSFPGPPPTTPVTVTINLPFQGFAAESLNRPPLHLARHFNVRFFAYSLFPFLALLIGWLVLWRSLTGWRLLGFALAVLVLGNLRLPEVPVLYKWEIGLTIAWWIVVLSVARTWRWAVTGTVAAAIACLALVLGDKPLPRAAAVPAASLRLGNHTKFPPANAPHHPDLLLTLLRVASAAAILVLVLTAVVALFHHLMKTFKLRNDTRTTDYEFRNTVTCVGILGLSFMYWFDLHWLPKSALPLDSLASGIADSVIKTSQWGGWPLARAGALTVVAFLAVKLCSKKEWANGAWALPAALMFGLAAPWSPNGDDVVVAVLSGLLWPLQALIICIGFRQILKREASILFPSDIEGSHPAAERETSSSPPSPPVVNKDHLPAEVAGEAAVRGTALGSAYLAARQAGYLSVPLVLYFVWTTLGQLHDMLSADWGILIVFIGLVAEAARWVVSGFVFGFLYEKIPGKIGPAKAACFVGLWVLSCLVPTAIARGMAVDLTQQFIYRSAQFALFILILSVLIDHAAAKSAGRNWQDLRAMYSAQKYGEIVTVFAPAAFLTVTLAHQILTGSGWDVAESFLGGLNKVVPAH